VAEEGPLFELGNYSSRWDDKYPQIRRSWLAHW